MLGESVHPALDRGLYFAVDRVDVIVIVHPATLGLAAIGTAMVERDGVTHVLDIVGREHDPTVGAFIDEARRMGISRRICRNSDFSSITGASRLLLLHPHADIANAPEFPASEHCPCHVPEHLAAEFGDACARLCQLGPLAVAGLPVVEVER